MKSVNAHRLFSELETAGLDELAYLRKEVVRPHEEKQNRTWGLLDAADLIGRSSTWLRDNDPDCPTDDQGKRLYSLHRINGIRERIGTLWKRPKNADPVIIANQNFKGGVGKTTTSIHLAHKAAISGLRVLLVDLDPQASLTYCAGNMIPDLELKSENLINRAMLESSDDFQYLPIETYFPNVDLVPTNLQLQDVEFALASNSGEIKSSPALRLKSALEYVKDDYDLIILDCPPNLGFITNNAIVAATAMLIPVPPSMLDRASFVLLCRSLRQLFEGTDKKFDWVKVLITKHNDDKLSNMQEVRMRDIYGDAVLEARLKMSVEIEKATTLLSSVYDQPRALNGRETRKRALATLDEANEEILNLIRETWESNL